MLEHAESVIGNGFEPPVSVRRLGWRMRRLSLAADRPGNHVVIQQPHSWYDLCPGLIDGNAVWSDQQVSSFPPRDAVTGSLPAHPGTSNSHVQRNSKEPDKCEQFSPRRLSLWQLPPSPLLALTIRLAHGSKTSKTRSTH